MTTNRIFGAERLPDQYEFYTAQPKADLKLGFSTDINPMTIGDYEELYGEDLNCMVCNTPLTTEDKRSTILVCDDVFCLEEVNRSEREGKYQLSKLGELHTCKQCGSTFAGRRKTYCSVICRVNAFKGVEYRYNEKHRKNGSLVAAEHFCKQCGNPVKTKGGYCSMKCKRKYETHTGYQTESKVEGRGNNRF